MKKWISAVEIEKHPNPMVDDLPISLSYEEFLIDGSSDLIDFINIELTSRYEFMHETILLLSLSDDDISHFVEERTALLRMVLRDNEIPVIDARRVAREVRIGDVYRSLCIPYEIDNAANVWLDSLPLIKVYDDNDEPLVDVQKTNWLVRATRSELHEVSGLFEYYLLERLDETHVIGDSADEIISFIVAERDFVLGLALEELGIKVIRELVTHMEILPSAIGAKISRISDDEYSERKSSFEEKGRGFEIMPGRTVVDYSEDYD